MITLHCSCGETLTSAPGPAAIVCRCGKSHSLPTFGAPAPAVAVAPPPAEPKRDSSPFHPAKRQAIHDGPVREKEDWRAMLGTPKAAGAASVLVLLMALLLAVVMKKRSDRLRAEAQGEFPGTVCTFEGAGVSFTSPPDWKLVKSENLTFEFDTAKGRVAVTVLQLSAESHEERLKGAYAGAAWTPGPEAGEGLPGAAVMIGAGKNGEEIWSWWLERKTHRLWVHASGEAGIKGSMAPVFKSMVLQ